MSARRPILSGKERDALLGVPIAVRWLYIEILLRMDWSTRLVGARNGARVSWRTFTEALYSEPCQGIAEDNPSEWRVRRMAGWLERRGLIQRQSQGAHLVFRCLLVPAHESAQKKAAGKPQGVSRTHNEHDFLNCDNDISAAQEKSPQGSRRGKAAPPLLKNITSIPNGIDDTPKDGASDGVVDELSPERMIWQSGLAYLRRYGGSEAGIRGYLGRLAKEYGKPALAAAIAECVVEAPVEPKAWIVGKLRGIAHAGSRGVGTTRAERRSAVAGKIIADAQRAAEELMGGSAVSADAGNIPQQVDGGFRDAADGGLGETRLVGGVVRILR